MGQAASAAESLEAVVEDWSMTDREFAEFLREFRRALQMMVAV